MSASAKTQANKVSERPVLGDLGRKAFSFPAFLGVLLVAGTFLALLGGLQTVSSDPVSASNFWLQGDTWWHLAIGRQILATHSWPRVDIYSFTMRGEPWIAYEWFGEVIMAAAWEIGHLQGLMVLLTALSGTVILLFFYYSYLRTRNAMASFLACAALLPLISLSFPLRPQLLGYAFLVITLITFEKFRQGHSKALWALPAVFLIWVNAHGTFVLGFLVLGACWAGGLWEFHFGSIYAKRWTNTQRRHLELAALFCLIASILTPYGTRLAAFPFEMPLFQPVSIKIVTEFEPFPLFSTGGAMFFGALVILCLALLTGRLGCQLSDLILLTLAAVETLLHSRFILLFVPLFAPFLAELFGHWLPKRQTHVTRPVANALLMACIVLGIVKLFPSESRLQAKVKLTAPVKAAGFISSHPSLGKMFANYDWGSYLMFDLGTAHQVFIDGRLDLYEGSGVFQDYLTVYWRRPGMWAVLSKYNIQSCLARRGSSLETKLAGSPEWKEIYHDPLSVIFVKPGRETGAGLRSAAHADRLAPSSRQNPG